MIFFFQAEDGIRYLTVTGVQTCALPIYPLHGRRRDPERRGRPRRAPSGGRQGRRQYRGGARSVARHPARRRVRSSVRGGGRGRRSEEHTSELQSQSNLVCRLLLEKKKNETNITVLLPDGEILSRTEC